MDSKNVSTKSHLSRERITVGAGIQYNLPEISLTRENSPSSSLSSSSPVNDLPSARLSSDLNMYEQNDRTIITLPSISTTTRKKSPTISNLNQKVEQHDLSNVCQNQSTLTGNNTSVKSVSHTKYHPSNGNLERFQRSRIVCLHSETNRYMNEFENMILPLQEGVDAIVTFIDSNELFSFLQKVPDEKIFFFITSDLAPSILDYVHPLSQIYVIFLIDGRLVENEPWVKRWAKIKNSSLIQHLAADEVSRRNHFSYVRSTMQPASSKQLSLLPCSFIITQLLKESFVQMKNDDEEAKKDLIRHCRQQCGDHGRESILDQFEKEYRAEDAIDWYTRGHFFHRDVNTALRAANVTQIFMMRLLIRDIHRQIRQCHQPLTEPKTLYRGQCLPCAEFEQLRLTAGSLYSFNSFLSTSTNYDVAYHFAESSRCTDKPVKVGVLFRIRIDPNAYHYATFASVADVCSYEDAEEEIIFTTNTIFRIGSIRQLEDQLWQVDLLTTTSHDKELERLAGSIRDATEGYAEWDRLGKSLLNLGFFDMAKEILDLLITKSEKGSSHYYHLMGLKELSSGHHQKALDFLQRALHAYQIRANLNRLHLVHVHFDTGSVYQQLGDWANALKSFRSALTRQKQSLPINYFALLSIYVQMAKIYTVTARYLEALEMYEKILRIREKCIPTNELEFADLYRDIAKMYYYLKNYPKSLSIIRKVERLRKSCTQKDDPISMHLACIVAVLVEKTREPEKTSENHRKILACKEELRRLRKKEPNNHSSFTIQYELMGQIYLKMKDYSRALGAYCNMLGLLRQLGCLPQTDVASTLDQIGEIHERMENREQACLAYEEAIWTEQNTYDPRLARLQLYRKHLNRAQKCPDYFDNEF